MMKVLYRELWKLLSALLFLLGYLAASGNVQQLVFKHPEEQNYYAMQMTIIVIHVYIVFHHTRASQ